MRPTFRRHASTGSGSIGGSSSSSSSSSNNNNNNSARCERVRNGSVMNHLPTVNTNHTESTGTANPSPGCAPTLSSVPSPPAIVAKPFLSLLLSSIPRFIIQLVSQILRKFPLYSKLDYHRSKNDLNSSDAVNNDVLKALLLERKRAIAEHRNGKNNNDTNEIAIIDDGVIDVDDADVKNGPKIVQDGEIWNNDGEDYLLVKASPGLTALLDHELYRAYQAELLPTVASASRLLTEFIAMKETSALILRECRWMVGVPFGGGITLCTLQCGESVALGGGIVNDVFVGEGALVDTNGMPAVHCLNKYAAKKDSTTSEADAASLHSREMIRWNEFDSIQDFAQQCYVASKEAIHRLTTDRLSDSANRTLQDSLSASSVGTVESYTDGTSCATLGPLPSSTFIAQTSVSQASPLPPLLVPSTPVDAGIGRCYPTLSRRDCWESPNLYCPDYCWADDAISGCQRLLKSLSKHRFVNLLNAHGWERYAFSERNEFSALCSSDHQSILYAPTYASCTPHVFPSLEVVHSLQYLVSDLLSTTIPTRLNQFRVATESNAVVSKRLYLVKCEYRAPLRALWESCINLNSAPKRELVKKYLREYHGVKDGERTNVKHDVSNGIGGGAVRVLNEGEIRGVGRGMSGRRRSTMDSIETAKKTSLQYQREKLETLITEEYWKHPTFVEALQLEKGCEELEMKMSQMLLPLANIASEIMDDMKGRLRALAVVNNAADGFGGDENSSPEEKCFESFNVLLSWNDVPFMKELLRRLKSIFRRKHESIGIRPLLLDLQGVPRHNQDPLDMSIDIPFYPTSCTGACDHDDEWFHLNQFVREVGKLLNLLIVPDTPFIIDERISGMKSDKSALYDLIDQCRKVWDEDKFCARYEDWFKMVKRQQKLNVHWGRIVNQETLPPELPLPSLVELSKILREAEIELSISMASKDQLERVFAHLESLRADKAARYKVLAQIVLDVGYRELNHGVLVTLPPDGEILEYPSLSVTGLFVDQLTLSGDCVPIG